jgi:RimJ/RimL family protein N-acetyltransferase
MELSITSLAPVNFGLVADWITRPEINQWLYAEWRERPVDARLIALAASNPKNRLWMVNVDGRPYGLVAIGGIARIDRSGVAWYLRGADSPRQPRAMTLGLKEVTRRAFEELGLHSVSASIIAGNEASRRVLIGAGYEYVGRMRSAFKLGDHFLDRELYDCIAD